MGDDGHEAAQVISTLTEAPRQIIGNANEAMPFGPFDCIDNDGQPYQSEAFANALKAGRDILARAALSKVAGTD